VPLSDHEQKILEEIEKSLYQEDPKFARDVKRRSPQMSERRRVKLGVLLFLVGFGILIGFFITSNIVIGVVAFGAMVGGIVLIAGSIKGLTLGRGGPGSGPRDRLMKSFEQWESRVRKRDKGS
jgi:hypothetical protein